MLLMCRDLDFSIRMPWEITINRRKSQMTAFRKLNWSVRLDPGSPQRICKTYWPLTKEKREKLKTHAGCGKNHLHWIELRCVALRCARVSLGLLLLPLTELTVAPQPPSAESRGFRRCVFASLPWPPTVKLVFFAGEITRIRDFYPFLSPSLTHLKDFPVFCFLNSTTRYRCRLDRLFTVGDNVTFTLLTTRQNIASKILKIVIYSLKLNVPNL